MTQGNPREVNINRNPQVPEGSPLPYPVYKVLGILPNQEAAWQAIDELTARGFVEEDIELWGGQAGAQAIEESFSQFGLVGWLTRLVQQLGEEGENIQKYDEALRAGGFLLVVPAPNPEAKQTVRDTMVAHGGHLISYFDDLTIEALA